MANRIVRVHAVIYGVRIYAIMLPSSGFCRTAARKCSVLPNVLELAYYAAYFQICDFTFQNIGETVYIYIYIIPIMFHFILQLYCGRTSF